MRQPSSPRQRHQGQESDLSDTGDVRETISLIFWISWLVHQNVYTGTTLEMSSANGLNGQQTEAQRVVSTWEQPSMFDNSHLSLCLLSVLFVLCSFFLHKQYIHLDQNSKDTKTHSVKSLPPNHAHQVANYPPWKQPVDPGYYLHMKQI